MSMVHFSYLCPGLAAAEPLALVVEPSDPSLPPGEYLFAERYCVDRGCDCRRVFLEAVSTREPGRILASINYGWENNKFYARRLGGDARSAREITSASLDPLNAQSELSAALLQLFRKHLRENPNCARQLRQHYEEFKQQVALGVPASQEAVKVRQLSIEAILRRLDHVPDQADFAPYQAALEAAVEQREAITPELLATLERVIAEPEEHLAKDYSCLHEFAILLLAQFREPRALDPFLRFFSLPGDLPLDLTADTVTEVGARILASVCGGDPAPLLRLALDESVNEYVREQAILGLLVQHVWNERSREELVSDLRGLFERMRRSEASYTMSALVGAVCDLDLRELLPEVRQAFADGTVDENMVGSRKDVEGELGAGPPTSPFWRSGEKRRRDFEKRNKPVNAITETSGWVCFRSEEEKDWDDLDEDFEDAAPTILPGSPSPAPYQANVKVGRNDLCPCGSGKKFKKCCG